MKHEEFDRLKDLLQLEFRPLSRLLLLLGWNQCRSLSSAQKLVNILHKEQVKTEICSHSYTFFTLFNRFKNVTGLLLFLAKFFVKF